MSENSHLRQHEGSAENLHDAMKNPRAKIYDVGGDIMQADILQSAFEGADGVFHFAACGYFSAMIILVVLSCERT